MWKSFFLAFPKDCGKLAEFSKQLWESCKDFHNCGNPGISTKLGAVEKWKTFSLLTSSPHFLIPLRFFDALRLLHPIALQVHLNDYTVVHQPINSCSSNHWTLKNGFPF